jgi:N-acetylglutamate synthase-like GNAT family acetyltransferase
MKIRKATKKDILQMLRIIRENNPKYPIIQAKKEILEMFSKSLFKPNYLLVEENNNLVGFGRFNRSWTDSTIFNLFWINISLKHQNKGLGNCLIKEIIKTIKKTKEKPNPKLITISTNKPKFWKRFGFTKLIKYDKDYLLMGLIVK